MSDLFRNLLKASLWCLMLFCVVNVWAQPSSGYALKLPGGAAGASSNMAIPALNAQITGYPYTVEMWVMPQAYSSYDGIWVSRTSANGSATSIQFDNNADQRLRCDVEGTSRFIDMTGSVVSYNEWHHIALVVTATQAKVIVDKTKTYTSTTAPGTYTNAFHYISYIGWDPAVADRALQGFVDDVRIWSADKSASLDAAIANPATESNLIAYYSFEAQSGADATGHGNNATVTGGTYVQLGSDADSDGVLDASDNCPQDANADQADHDKDGEGNVCDADFVVDSECYVAVYPNGTNLVPGGGYMNSLTGFGGWGNKAIASDAANITCGNYVFLDRLSGSCYPNSAALDLSSFAWKASTSYRIVADIKTVGGSIGFLASGSAPNYGYAVDTQGEWKVFDDVVTTGTSPTTGFISFNGCDYSSSYVAAYIDNYQVYEVPNDEAGLYNVTLSTGTYESAFHYNTNTYNVTLQPGTTSVTTTPKLIDPKATVTGAGAVDVSSGSGVATLEVTARDAATKKTYTINFSVLQQSNDATLSSLSVSKGVLSPAFSTAVTSYEVLVPFGTTSIDLTTTTTDTNAQKSGDGSIDLSSGDVTADVVITAEDGVTTKTYSVHFMVAAEGANYALYLPGQSGAASHVQLPAIDLSALPLTIEMWFKTVGEPADYTGLFYNVTNGGLGFTGWQQQDGVYAEIGGTYDPADQYSKRIFSDEDAIYNEWNHVAVVLTADSRTLYINDVAKTESFVTTVPNFNTGTTYLGWRADDGNNRSFIGWLDEVRVWSTARSAVDLKNNKYKSLDPASESGLVAYWNFDDVDAKANDLTAHNYDGTITGGKYEVSDVFKDMEYVSSSLTPKSTFANNKGTIAMASLAINTKYALNALSLAQINLSAAGSTQLSDISDVMIYGSEADLSAHSNAIASLGSSPASESFTIDLNQLLVNGTNEFWIGYEIASSAVSGNELDLAVVDFTLAAEANSNTYTPENADPDGVVTIKPEIFPSSTLLGEDIVTMKAQTSSGGANFVSFQQNAIMTYKGYQYVTYWNDENNNDQIRVAIARKKLPDGQWQILELNDHTITAARQADNHYSISMGICPNDGTIHIVYDLHNDVMNYQVSVAGLANDPENFAWTDADFSAKRDYLIAGTTVSNATYPRFIAKPNGDLLFEMRIGWSGDGNSYLWEYYGDTHNWFYIGEYVNGTEISENAYINGMHYDPSGRLHVSWVWRQTPDAQTNHDVYYAYSDDDGRTWFNDAGTEVGKARVSDTDPTPMSRDTQGLKVISINTYRGLINQESQAVDSDGRIHILQSYINESKANASSFWDARVNDGELRHIYKDDQGVWQSDKVAMSGGNRSEIAVDALNNVYVVAWDNRVYFAAASEGWKNWIPLDISRQGTAQSEPLIDKDMLLNENVLSYVYAHSDNNGKVVVPYYQMASFNPALKDLAVDAMTISGFDPELLSYSIELPYGTTAIPSVSAAAKQYGINIQVTNPETLPGTVTVLATANNGVSLTYEVEFTIAKNTDASLSSIASDAIDLVDFNKETLEYSIELPVGTTLIPVTTAVAVDANATVQITEPTELPGDAVILVTAEDGITTKIYTVSYTVAIASDASLKDLKVSGTSVTGFSASVFDYNVILAPGTSLVPVVTATANSQYALGVVVTPAASLPGTTEVVVTAQDNSTETYTINFTVALSTDASLSSISVDQVNIVNFSSQTLSYDVVLPYGSTAIPVVDAAVSYPTATFEITPATQLPGSTSILVTAEDGVSQLIYSVNFTVAKSDDAKLKDLLLNGATVAGFDPALTSYTIVLPYGVTNMPVITAETNFPDATYVATSVTSLPATVFVVVTAANGTTKKVYTLNISEKAPEKDATLKSLNIDGALIAGFDASVFNYNIELPVGTTAIPVATAEATSTVATLQIAPATALPGTTVVTVTAQDGTTTKAYQVNFTVAKSTDAKLSDLKVDGNTVQDFNAETLTYSVELPVGTTTVPVVSAIASDVKATISVADATALPGTTSVTVTAEDGVTQKIYSIAFTVIKSDDATLSDLMLNGTTLAGFESSQLTYAVNLPIGTTTFPVVSATVSYHAATVVIAQADLTSSKATVSVTAEDGTTTKVYEITFTILKSTDASLSALKVDGVNLNDFATTKLDYAVELPAGTEDLPVVSAIASYANASVVVTQVTSLPGTATVKVTAEDGTTIQTYSIAFTVELVLSNDKVSEVSIYPNPVSDFVTIKALQNIQNIRLYDLSGALLRTQEVDQLKEIKMEVSDLEKGIYLIEIHYEDKSAHRFKLMK